MSEQPKAEYEKVQDRLFSGESFAQSRSGQTSWLFSRRADFWLVSGGASAALLAALALIAWHGEREVDWLDFVLAEFHLGATYDAVIRRRLWRERRVDVLLLPLVILAVTYVLSLSGRTTLLTSIAMYAAVWHRGRQSLGVACFYQRGMGGPVSRAHQYLFRGAIYLPMLAGVLAYTHLAPSEYEGEPYLALSVGQAMTSFVAFAAAAWVAAYLAWAIRRNRGERAIAAPEEFGGTVHPGEWWVVLAHAVAFGSGYVLGASNGSFLLVLAVYHEVQYLYFTCAMARRSAGCHPANQAAIDAAVQSLATPDSKPSGQWLQTEAGNAAAFMVWPVTGFAGSLVGGWLQFPWLAPLGMGGLFCHYWLDARIWTRASFRH